MFRKSDYLSIHPLALVGLFVSKKVIAYNLAKVYGFPRLYRRLLEANRSISGYRTPQYARVRDTIHTLFRLPDQFDVMSPESKRDIYNVVAQVESAYSPLPAGTLSSFLKPDESSSKSASSSSSSSSVSLTASKPKL